MGRREYGQPCSLASALDQIGERWSLLIVRELLLGPLRFSELSRAVGGAPTDVLTKRLRDLEEAGIVSRRELGPPVSATAYELTGLGRELERPLLEMGRWGLHFQDAANVAAMPPEMLPTALRVVLRPPQDAELTIGLRTGGRDYTLRARDGWLAAGRGEAGEADLTLSGTPFEVMATLVAGADDEGAEVGGDPEVLAAVREMVSIPEALRQEAIEAVAAVAVALT